MSLRALTWAIYDIAPNLTDASAYRVLLVLADEADNDGRGAGLSAATIASRTGLSKRTVDAKLKTLEEMGITRRGDQRIVAYLPANRRPIVRDLNMPADTRGAKSAHQNTPAATATRGADSAPPTPEPDMQQGCNRGATDMQQGCSLSAHNPINPINPINPREAAREHDPDTDTTQPTSREQALADWSPNSEHEALAASEHADLDVEADKFRCKQLSDGHIAKNLDAAFTLWLRRGIEGGYLTRRTNRPSDTTHTPEPHRHTMTCEHVQAIMGPEEHLYNHERNGFAPSEWMRACQAQADILNRQEHAS